MRDHNNRPASRDRSPAGSAGRTRRQLLTGTAAAAAGALAAQAAFPASPAYAGTDGDVVLGAPNTAADVTSITCTTGGVAGAVWATGTGATPGVHGTSVNGPGVLGDGNPGVYGLAYTAGGSGVEGDVVGTVNANGVYGHARNSDASGVYGQNEGTGYGVAGRANSGTGVLGDSQDGTGIFAHTVTGNALAVIADGAGSLGLFSTDGGSGDGSAISALIRNPANASPAVAAVTAGTGPAVLAQSGTGVALHVVGKAVFSRSGLATVKAGTTTVTVRLPGVTSSSLILATPHQHASQVAVASAVPRTGSFTIHLTRAPASNLQVGYLVLG